MVEVLDALVGAPRCRPQVGSARMVHGLEPVDRTGVKLDTGEELSADLIVHATGYGSMNVQSSAGMRCTAGPRHNEAKTKDGFEDIAAAGHPPAWPPEANFDFSLSIPGAQNATLGACRSQCYPAPSEAAPRRDLQPRSAAGDLSVPMGKAYVLDTHRTVAPRGTLSRVSPFLGRMGITRVANVTGLDRIGIPVVMVSRPASRSVSVAQGKGLTLDAAKASGVMEALETWHAERISLPLRYGSQADLQRDVPLAEIDRLPRVRSSRFTADTRILWIEGEDLVTREKAWLPFEMVHTDYTHPSAPGHGCFACSSNGLASGNDFLEAVCHAVCELIERDATSLWHHLGVGAKERTRLRPETVDEPVCVEAMQRIRAAGLDCAIFDTSTDIAVASFRCLIVDEPARSGHIGIGDGCHPHRGIALLRALTEAVQTRMTYISGARDDMMPDEFTEQAIGEKLRFARDAIGRSEPVRSYLDCPHRHAADFADDLDWLLARLSAVGCGQVLAVDLARPEIGVPVVRVVVPGLEAPHDDDSYVPGPRAAAAETIAP